MISKRDWTAIVIIGMWVGLLAQFILANLWGDIAFALNGRFGFVPPQWAAHIGIFLGFTLLAPLALLVLSLLAKYVAPVIYQIGKFAAVGSSNAAVDIGLLNLISLFVFIDKGWWVFQAVASATAFLATINSFLWNKFWTFEAGKSEEKTLMQVVRFYAVTGLVAILNGYVTGLIASSVLDAGLSDAQATNVGKVAGIFAGMTFNFLGYKFIVFKKKDASPVPAGTA